MEDALRPVTIACAECGVAITCKPGPECWCATLPPQPMGDAEAGCLCPGCLGRRAERLGEIGSGSATGSAAKDRLTPAIDESAHDPDHRHPAEAGAQRAAGARS